MADRASRLLTPRVVFGAFAVLIVVAVLFTPNPTERDGDTRLSSRFATPQGARGLAETLGRLGWSVERRTHAFTGPRAVPPEPRAVHAVLYPPIQPRESEIGALLAEVRRGGALLAVVARRSPLADSLGYQPSLAGTRYVPDDADTAGCAKGPWGRGGAMLWPDGEVHTWWLVRAGTEDDDDSTTSRSRTPTRKPGERDLAFGGIGTGRAWGRVTARGFPLGAGRVVVVADPDLLRNDVLRVCRWGVGVEMLRAVAWLGETPGISRRIVFDEYHQGGGDRPHPARVVARTLGLTRGGRAVLALLVAALVWLAAAAPRALPPVHRPRLARRSPLEHVDALARAYAQVRATRLVARRLARGLRRRHARGGTRNPWRASEPHGDAAFLRAAASRHPQVAADVERLLRDEPTDDPRALATSAAAVDRALTPRSSLP